MHIEQVCIRNYKSIDLLEFEPHPGLNAFIGENSVGKSNIFDAMNWPLKPVYPSFNSTTDEDRYLGKPENKISIKLTFSDRHTLELSEEWIDQYGKTKCGLNRDRSYIKNEVRDAYCSAYLGIEREVHDYLPANRWTILGRILQQINEQFKKETITSDEGEVLLKSDLFKKRLESIRDELLFSVKDDNGNEIMKQFVSILQQETAAQLNKPESHFNVDLSLYDPWNFYRTLQVLVNEHETGMKFQASTLGMGVQAAISIAILKAYSELSLANKTPIFIDEPELYLHPQAQLNFYKILRSLADKGTQVFYTTHSPNFISTGYFDEIYLVRKTKERGTIICHADPQDFAKDWEIRNQGHSTTSKEIMDRYRNAYEETGDTQRANEAFFGKKVILVEGQSESLLLPLLFELAGFDYVKEGITIVRCGAKSELDRFYRLYSELGLPCYILFDGDKQLEQEEPKEIGSNIAANRSLLELLKETEVSDYPNSIPKRKYLGFETELENYLGFPTAKKGLELFKEARTKFSKANLPTWLSGLIEAIRALSDNDVSSVLRTVSSIQTPATETQLEVVAPVSAEVNYESEIKPEDLPF